jgi:hypothetical protein
MTVGDLSAHLALSVLQVGTFLDGRVVGSPPVNATTYYSRLEATSDPTSTLNRGVAERSRVAARAGASALGSAVQAALTELIDRLPREPADRRVAVLHRPGEELLLDEYLRVRCVEISVHLDDLGRSLHLPLAAPAEAVAVAVDVLVDAARERHGDAAVLRALTRRELDTAQALRVL